jgi:beta-aspartyl-peptidase (threonine type)
VGGALACGSRLNFLIVKEDQMRLRLVTCLVVAALPLVALSQTPPPEEAKAIRAVLDAQVAAWNKGDLDGFMAGYWKSPGLSFYSGKTKLRGWQATLDRYRKRYQTDGKEMGKLSFSDLDIERIGSEHALVRGRFQLMLKEESPSGLFTLILKKLPEGWRIIHDHTS